MREMLRFFFRFVVFFFGVTIFDYIVPLICCMLFAAHNVPTATIKPGSLYNQFILGVSNLQA